MYMLGQMNASRVRGGKKDARSREKGVGSRKNALEPFLMLKEDKETERKERHYENDDIKIIGKTYNGRI